MIAEGWTDKKEWQKKRYTMYGDVVPGHIQGIFRILRKADGMWFLNWWWKRVRMVGVLVYVAVMR